MKKMVGMVTIREGQCGLHIKGGKVLVSNCFRCARASSKAELEVKMLAVHRVVDVLPNVPGPSSPSPLVKKRKIDLGIPR